MKILITGGLGFIGINAALRYLEKGHDVTLLDNLDKLGSFKNYDLVKHYKNVKFIKGDIRLLSDVENVFKDNDFELIFHLAAQTAVTTSLTNPRKDFETNAIGTFNVLECMVKYTPLAKLIFSSTNKVYGDLTGRQLIEEETRYWFDRGLMGITETEPLDFYSPYGCSKGTADQYVRDYARIYNLNTVVIRQSCIYGKYQNGTEDQGWVAWFIKAFMENKDITIFGDGKQVRDILYIDDLIDLYELVAEKSEKGQIYNAGGSYWNTVSILEIIDILKDKIGDSETKIGYGPERDGDQKIFVSNNAKAQELGWRPKVSIDMGVNKLIEYLKNK